ncbi:xyloglucan endotransglucosylase/hydrolase protein 9-like [Phoenix dactylifera]|uniref:Xyloglucan endotransglucosylase/hydrolase n=1 Tax=Phoenix dactylifera TaxID=42345 RepID=A0A8B8ZJW8_PHODC|nr:xyloglucan endotransglucosylase/hydrolase protein 9-like [Phoenix dactylifera]
MGSQSNRLLCCLSLAMLLISVSSAKFSDLFQPYWGADNIVALGEPLKLALDSTSGCGFGSKKKYLFGQASMQIKLVEGDSAGTVTAFYMSSDGPNHNELDFEFLGNLSGEPYLVQTNVYVDGSGNREQRHSLWFDPTIDFHTYSILWNHHHIRFLVDGIPIRVFANKEANGIPYPRDQAMGVYGSVWNADDWATQGGRVKTNWSHAPFVSAFRAFEIDACELPAEAAGAERCEGGGAFWWDAAGMSGLSPHQQRQLRWVRKRHLVYDYCKDTARSSEMPGECLN